MGSEEDVTEVEPEEARRDPSPLAAGTDSEAGGGIETTEQDRRHSSIEGSNVMRRIIIALLCFQSSILFALAANARELPPDVVPGQSLVYNDFILYGTCEESFQPYGDNMLAYINASYPSEEYDGGCWFVTKPLVDIDPPEYRPETYRGIVLGESSKDDIIEMYGIGIDTPFDENSDFICTEFAGDTLVPFFQNNASSILIYDYEKKGQLAFIIDDDNVAIAAFYSSNPTGYAYTPTKETIQSVQEYLNNNGYDCGKVDGIAGSGTNAAIARYQEAMGLYVSGYIDDTLIKSMDEHSQNNESKVKLEEESSETEVPETEDYQTEVDQRSPYRTDISYEELMRNPYDHLSELYTFSGTVLQLFDSKKIRLALNGNSDEQIVCSYGWLSMPVDLLEGDTVTIYGTFEGKEKYTNVLNVDTEFPQFLCYKMDTPGGEAKPWTNTQIKAVKRAEEKALSE